MKKLVIVIIVLLISNQIYAQDYNFGKVSKKELEEKYYPLDSSANAAILYKNRKTYYNYGSGGAYLMSEIHMRIKIYNPEGFKYGTNKINIAFSKSEKESVNGLKANTYNLVGGKVEITKLDKKDIFKEGKDKFNRELKFTMPNLKEGSVIEWKYTLRSPFYTSIDDMVIQYEIPVKKYVGKVTLLEYFKFNKRQKGHFYFQIKEVAKNNLQYGTVDKQYIVDVDNIPALKKEAYVNNINNFRAGIVFEVSQLEIPGFAYESFSNNWEDITKNIYKSSKFGGELNKKGLLKDEMSTLKNELTSIPEKIVGGLEYVKAKVKWNGYLGKYCHDGLKHACKTNVGNSAEVNLLLVSVLRNLGLNANPVLLSTRKNGIPLMPTSDGLNYVIAAVETEKGTVLLDATEEYSTPNVLPMRTLNWKGRLVRKDGSSSWVNLNSKVSSEKNVTMSVEIDDEGFVEGMNRTNYTSLNALNYRKTYAKIKDEEIASKIEEKNEGLEISEYKISNKKNGYKPVVELFKFSSEEFTDLIGDKIYFKPLFFSSITENPFKLDERAYPIDFGAPTSTKNMINITVPEGYAIEFVPKNLAIALPNNYGMYRFNIQVNGNKINLFSSFKINTPIYPAQNYQEIKEFYKIVIAKNLEQIVLKKV